jgi:hypothetical protein
LLHLLARQTERRVSEEALTEQTCCWASRKQSLA